MKKICFVAVNSRYSHLNLTGLYLRESVRDLNVDFCILEFDFKSGTVDILSAIHSQAPDCVAFSVYIWNAALIKVLIKDIKKILPDVCLVLGGPEVSYHAKAWRQKYPEIDHIICGPGETQFRDLISRLYGTGEVKDCQVQFRNIPFPYQKSDFVGMESRYVYYESSRGCVYNCAYCLSSRKDLKVELRDLEQVKYELKFLLDQKPKIVKFLDRTFNYNKTHSREIWKFLLSFELLTTFHFEIHPGLLEDRDFEILDNPGVSNFQFELGIQSINQATIRAINRPENVSLSLANIKRLIEKGRIHIHVGLIAGLPFESYASFKDTFNQTYNLRPHHLQLGFLKILPGTKMRENARMWHMDYMDAPPYQVFQTKWLSFGELCRLREIEVMLNLIYNSENFLKTLEYLHCFYKTPFELYESLGRHCFHRGLLEQKDWQKTARLIISFTEKCFPDQTDCIKDALRWDWCFVAKGQYYPDFLRKAGFGQIEMQMRKRMVSKLREDNALWDSLSQSDLNRAIVFNPVSRRFKENERLKDWVLFLSHRGQLFQFDCDELNYN